MMTAVGTDLLIVDDHPDTAAIVLRAARRRGYDGDVVFSGHAALRRMEAFPPRVVVLDEMMPDMGGLEVLREMRENLDLAGVKVIVYSASYDWEKQRDAYLMGAVKWFVKGVDRLDTVFDAIEACLRQ